MMAEECKHFMNPETCISCEEERIDKTYCRGCKAEEEMHRPIDQHWWARRDAYGIYTGIYCDDCYNSDKYPYRKDNYHDPMYAGERMNPDDNLPWEY